MEQANNIVWLKRDLRLEDHAALFEARKHGRVIAVYIIEPEYWALPDTSGRQWEFIADALHELAPQLARLGIPLLFYHGDAVAAFDKLVETIPVQSIHAHQETGNYWTFERDKRVLACLAHHQVPLIEHMQHGVFRRLNSRNGWADRWDAMMGAAGPPLPARQEWPTRICEQLKSAGFAEQPVMPKMKVDNCLQRQKGRRDEGLALLASFLAGRGEHYRKAMSSPLEGADACSRLSPHLAVGTLSIRETFQAAVERLMALDKGNPANKAMRQSLVSFIGRLHWHCHFIQKLEATPEMEWQELHPAYRGMRNEADAELLERWSSGHSGWPFLDACMRSLQATGWLNFRMRAMVMAIASYHLWQPWQRSGEMLARLFTDYEPGIHWPQVQMQSGTTGINTIRIYNPVKQGYDQDPNGIFIKRWVPELAGLEGKALHEPWISGRVPPEYCEPIGDYQSAAREARDKIWAVRKEKGFAEAKRKVLEKHASRKQGVRSKSTRRPNKVDADRQLGFDF